MPTNSPVSPVLEASIDINATPARVWAIVSDLKSMGERSPQTKKSIPLGAIKPGTVLLNLNNEGWKWWPTTARVTTCEPQREIAFKIIENGSEWAYTLTPVDGGQRTHLVEQRRAPRGTSKVSQFLVKNVLGGNDAFEAGLVRGMEATLAKVKELAERQP